MKSLKAAAPEPSWAKRKSCFGASATRPFKSKQHVLLVPTFGAVSKQPARNFSRPRWRGKHGDIQIGGNPDLRGLLTTAGQLWASLDNLINDRPIKVAITGLSRSGKTVFLTSLIANLLAMGTGRPAMPALRTHIDKTGKERLRNIHLVPARASTTPRFDYLGKLADLAAAHPK